jgi:Tol biopolymer transport system component
MRKTTKTRLVFTITLAFSAFISLDSTPAFPEGPAYLLDPREGHLAGLVQLTHGGENAEAYWSPDGRELTFQSTRPPYGCDQILRMSADGIGEPLLVSTGKGRTTCAYYTADGKRILYSSTHHAGDACPVPPDRSQGYVWPVDRNFEIWSALPDGSDLKRVTDNDAYDAESTVCPVDGAVVFTSTRDGDLDLYLMGADGGGIARLTDVPGYDGGAFFSNDCKKIVWRASRPAAGPELDEYRKLLGQGLVRPTKLEIWVADVDGRRIHNARQITQLGAASFAPSFFPSGERILFSSNYGDPKGREFDVWAVNVDGSGLERITYSAGFDGFPLLSPDGTRLAFSSNRGQGAPGDTNVFVARWVEKPVSPAAATYMRDIQWLADDAREGRGIGTMGLEESSRYLAKRFKESGIEPAGEDGGYFQRFDAPVAVEAKQAEVTLDGEAVARAELEPAAFSASTRVEADVVAAGYGITAPELSLDDYKGIDAKGKIVLVRRFVPPAATGEANERRYGDFRYKAWNAREHGAVGLIVVDAPLVAEGEQTPGEAPLPALRLDNGLSLANSDAGIPVVTLSRATGSPLFQGAHRAAIAVELLHRSEPAVNVVGVVRAGAPDRLPGAVLVGAHYDHIGLGGASSLSPDAHEPHNGADDNASGTAAVLEVGRLLAGRRAELHRDVYLVAFSGEELGVLGSTAFTRHPPGNLRMEDLVAMLNMDMVGRLRGNALSVLGADSAEEWRGLVNPACEKAELACTLGGDGYGPSDQYPFYAAGVPVLHFFTGVHEDYHKPTDDADKINAEGGVRVAALVAHVAEDLAGRPTRLAYKNLPAPMPRGDARSMGASLGTVPDYAGDGRPGVLLSGVRAGSPAEVAGIRRGDLLVELAGTQIRDINDFMYVLRRAKPGEVATAVVVRNGERVPLDVTFGVSQGIR